MNGNALLSDVDGFYSHSAYDKIKNGNSRPRELSITTHPVRLKDIGRCASGIATLTALLASNLLKLPIHRRINTIFNQSCHKMAGILRLTLKQILMIRSNQSVKLAMRGHPRQ